MDQFTRREFGGIALASGMGAQALRGATGGIDQALRSGIARRKIPCAVGMVATKDKITYQGAFGTRDAVSGIPVKGDSIFLIASMTKAITSAAALQLMEQGKVKLEEPLSKFLPDLGKAQVFEGVDESGKPKLRPVRTPVTLKHLLTHTSGLAYDTWSGDMQTYEKAGGTVPSGVAPLAPLVFEPGTRWQYGYSTDWAGKLVEALSGMTLEQYFQQNLLEPLGMKDTSFILPEAKFERLVTLYDRQPDGTLKPRERAMPVAPVVFSGGGGLFSTAGDYVRFAQMILRHGRGADGKQILQAATIDKMTANQIGDLSAGKLKTYQPARSSDVDVHPGARDGWGLGFLINHASYDGGRSAGSLAWAGINNTFYWIDPKRDLCAVLMMQFLPFVDREAVGLLSDFEKAVYAS